MDAKDSNSDWVVWRGAAVMAGIQISFQIFFNNFNYFSSSGLESAQELWIRPREWSKCGQTGRTDALLSVSSPWTTPDYLTNKTIIIIIIIVVVIIIMI